MTTTFPINDQLYMDVDDAGDFAGLRAEGRLLPLATTYPVWDDLRFPAQGINPAGQTSPPSVDATTFPGTLLFGTASPSLIGGVAQMPHAWYVGSAIRPHIHWSKTTSAAGGVVWEWCYAMANVGDVFGAYSAWLPATEAVPDSDTAAKQAIARLPELDMTGKRESVMLAWQVRRNTAAVADDYAADARMWEFDIHYQTNKAGTVSEIPT